MMAAFRRITSCHAILPALLMAFVLSASSTNAQQQPTPDEVQAAVDKKAAEDKAAAEKTAAAMAAIKKLPECSLAKTNKSCRITIERTRPLTPPTLQMYSGDSLTVIVKNPVFFERYFLDYTSGQATLKPDVASSIAQGLLAPLAKVGEFLDFDDIEQKQAGKDLCLVDQLTATTIAVGKVFEVIKPARECVTQLARRASSIYKKLEPFIAPDSSPAPGFTGQTPAATKQDLDRINNRISSFYTSEFVLSARVSAISNDSGIKASTDQGDRVSLVELSDLQKLADAIANDLLGYSVRITGLNERFYKPDFHDCAAMGAGEAGHQCVIIKSAPDNDTAYQNMVTRTLTYSVNTLNLISNSQAAALDPTKKKLVATLTLNFADSPATHSSLRWEASAGAFFSSLPARSFAAAPVFTNGVITDKKIVQNVLRPTVVPFAAGNYRLTSDLPWSRWKSNLYWTGAAGVNPSTVTADFATGLSLSWRALMVSFLCHFGHDLRLTQGLTVGESLGAGFNGSIPTKTYWTESFAIGLSVRVPSLTGR